MTTGVDINLALYDIEILLDKSASMNNADCPGGKTRWEYAKEQTVAVAQEADKHDKDGIGVVPFNNHFKMYDNTNASKVDQIFSEQTPSGSTDTAGVLKNRLDAYFDRKKAGNAKPLILLVMTDGAPDDQKSVERVIIEAANKIEKDEEIGIQFLQIGQDTGARAFLKHLDDELQPAGAKFDIVDTTNMDEAADKSLKDILMEAVTD